MIKLIDKANAGVSPVNIGDDEIRGTLYCLQRCRNL